MGIRSASENVLDCLSGFMKMPGEGDIKLFYGLELEVYFNCYYDPLIMCNGDEQARQSSLTISEIEKDMAGLAILKPDCHSEIVTVPATLRYHREKLWKKFLANSCNRVTGREKEIGAGLHIHFSRDALTDLQLAKVIYFIHNITNNTFLTEIAGRGVHAHAFAGGTKSNIKGLKLKDSYQQILNQQTYARDAISISKRNSGKSVEVRIFQSNPTEQGIFQAIEFLDALIKYCASKDVNDEELEYRSFMSWFKNTGQRTNYKYFYTNLVKHKYLRKTLNLMFSGKTA